MSSESTLTKRGVPRSTGNIFSPRQLHQRILHSLLAALGGIEA